MPVTRTTDSVSINLRIKKKQRDLIDRVAGSQGRSRSDFMVDAAYREAQNALLDQALITVDEASWEKYQALLEEPLPPTDKLRRLLKTRLPWESE